MDGGEEMWAWWKGRREQKPARSNSFMPLYREGARAELVAALDEEAQRSVAAAVKEAIGATQAPRVVPATALMGPV